MLAPEPETRDSAFATGCRFWSSTGISAPRTRRYMMVRRFREVLERADLAARAAGARFWAVAGPTALGGRALRAVTWRASTWDSDQLRWARGALPDGATLGLTQANAKSLPFPRRLVRSRVLGSR